MPRSTPDPAQLEINPALNVVGAPWIEAPDRAAIRARTEDLIDLILGDAFGRISLLPELTPEEVEMWGGFALEARERQQPAALRSVG